MISEARSALLAVFTAAGIRGVEVVPERITPPLAVLEPSSDWVQSGDIYGSFRVGFDVTMIVQTAANETVSKNLDMMVDDVLEAVSNAAGFYVASVGAPQLLTVQNAEFLTATLTVYQNTKL
jgi:hypothetical protein